MTRDQVAELVQVWRDAHDKGYDFHYLTAGRLAAEKFDILDQRKLDDAAKDLAIATGETVYVEVVHNDPRMKTEAIIWSNTPWAQRIGIVEFRGTPNA